MFEELEKRCDRVQVRPLFPHILNENHLVESLENIETLSGHTGCVNTLRWNKTGCLLASGSDDRQVKVWRGGAEIVNIATEHEGNVFAVEFLPCSGDRQLVTGAADHFVFLHDLETKKSKKWESEGRIKRMCTVEHDPTMFWAASEGDGRVLQFDTRSDSPDAVVCHGPTNPHKCSVKSVAISEAKPHLLVVGFEETAARLYDRRRFNAPVLTFAPCELLERVPWVLVDASPRAYHATHVAFNKTGTEVVVNQGSGGGVVVFSVDEEKDPHVMQRLHTVLDKPGEPVISSRSLPHPELREQGSNAIREKHFGQAVDFYSGLIVKKDKNRAFHSVCHSNRATALLLRRQKGDTYACIRDSVTALEIHRGNSKALFRLIKSFATMEHKNLAKKCIDKFKEWFPNDTSIKKIEEEVNLLNPSDDDEPELEPKEGFVDYQQRFSGCTNYQTDIKEANFFGSRDQFIVAGSDCGYMYIWNRDTHQLMGIWRADDHICNIVQPHPDTFLLASSGIDDVIRLWEPSLERPDDFESRKHSEPFAFMETRAEGLLTPGVHLHVLRDFIRESPQCAQS